MNICLSGLPKDRSLGKAIFLTFSPAENMLRPRVDGNMADKGSLDRLALEPS